MNILMKIDFRNISNMLNCIIKINLFLDDSNAFSIMLCDNLRFVK